MERRESIIYSPKKENKVIKKQTPLVDCNPILEGFENAKIVSNDNSNLFSKL